MKLPHKKTPYQITNHHSTSQQILASNLQQLTLSFEVQNGKKSSPNCDHSCDIEGVRSQSFSSVNNNKNNQLKSIKIYGPWES